MGKPTSGNQLQNKIKRILICIGIGLYCSNCSSFTKPKNTVEYDALEGAFRNFFFQQETRKKFCLPERMNSDLGFDYLFCLASEYVSLVELKKWIGIDPWHKGPHGEEVFVGNDSGSFAHHNPDFLKVLFKTLELPERSSLFVDQTKTIYTRDLSWYVRVAYLVKRKLNSNDVFYQKESMRYQNLLEENRLEPYYLDRFQWFLHPDFTDSDIQEDASVFMADSWEFEYNGLFSKEMVGFWIRRKCDKTEKLWESAMLRILKLYDEEILK